MLKKAFVLAACLLLSPKAPGQDPTRMQFAELESKIEHATETKDIRSLDKSLADDYISIGVGGVVRSKKDILQAYQNDVRIVDVRSNVTLVRLYGNIAIVTGQITVKGNDRQRDISGSYAFTRVFESKGNQWLAVTFQVTPIK